MHCVHAVSKLVSQGGRCIECSGISIQCHRDEAQEEGCLTGVVVHLTCQGRDKM